MLTLFWIGKLAREVSWRASLTADGRHLGRRLVGVTD